MVQPDPLPIRLQPEQRLAVALALARFFAHHLCPYPDPAEWRAECELEAISAVLRYEANNTHNEPLVVHLESGGCQMAESDDDLRGLWERLNEAERRRVLVLARHAENALRRFWRSEQRYYSHAVSWMQQNEEGEWVEQERIDKQALDPYEEVIEALDGARFLAELQSRLNHRERAVLVGVLEGKCQQVIAQELGITQQAVSKHWRRIRQQAKILRAEWGW